MNESIHLSQIVVVHLSVMWGYKIYWPVYNDVYSVPKCIFIIYEHKIRTFAGPFYLWTHLLKNIVVPNTSSSTFVLKHFKGTEH